MAKNKYLISANYDGNDYRVEAKAFEKTCFSIGQHRELEELSFFLSNQNIEIAFKSLYLQEKFYVKAEIIPRCSLSNRSQGMAIGWR